MEFCLPISITEVRDLARNSHIKIVKAARDHGEMISGLNFTVEVVQVVISGEYLCPPFLLEWLSVVENRRANEALSRYRRGVTFRFSPRWFALSENERFIRKRLSLTLLRYVNRLPNRTCSYEVCISFR